MIQKALQYENKNIPIISIIIYCFPFILGTIITGKTLFDKKEMDILLPQLPYLIIVFYY